MSKPADILLRDTHEDWPGVEFKSHKRQVVAAGSIHPETHEYYLHDPETPPLSDPLMPAPPVLIRMIKQPQRDHAVTGSGQATAAQMHNVYESLEAEAFGEHDDWLRLMMACHFATGGDGRAEFIEWSISDPKFQNDAEIIGRRWDSLHTDRDSEITTLTLNHILREHKASNAQVPAIRAKDEFDDEGDIAEMPASDPIADWDADDGVYDPAAPENAWLEDGLDRSWLYVLNDKYTAVFASGRYRIMYREEHNGGFRWSTASKQDFVLAHENRRVIDPNDPKGERYISQGAAWQKWPHRKTAYGSIFDTTAESNVIIGESLNLWGGFGVIPCRGEWSRFKRMLLEDICAGQDSVFEYLMKWLAWVFQNPGSLPEVAIVLKGAKGTGKSTLGEAVRAIFGEHGMCASHYEQIFGRFNGHLEWICFLYGDELAWGGNKSAEASLKKLITDHDASYEHKGVPVYTGVNHVALMLGSNENWVVPATVGERRFFVTQTSSAHKSPDGAGARHPNQLYWAAIYKELNNGGREAILYEMLNMDLGRWHPRSDIPQTAELSEQKVEGFTGIERWYFERLQAADIFETYDDNAQDWGEEEVRVRPGPLTSTVQEYMRRLNPHATLSHKRLCEKLNMFGWKSGDECRDTKTKIRYWIAPGLSDARSLFDKLYGGSFFADL